MRTLYLLRHAKSSWDDPSLPDDERPLAPRGRRDGKRIAEHLRRHEIEPELVLCSSAARTR
ncbi:MAG TPA: histidine phosphatase family protein, partial [Gaiellaceae bacterium]|nr:histidine phosphatase family protein [Gaiellaceae bacterium]